MGFLGRGHELGEGGGGRGKKKKKKKCALLPSRTLAVQKEQEGGILDALRRMGLMSMPIHVDFGYCLAMSYRE